MAATQGLHPGSVLCLLPELREPLTNIGKQEEVGQAHQAEPQASARLMQDYDLKRARGPWTRAKLELRWTRS